MSENSSDNLPRPELSKPAGHLLGDSLVKVIGAAATAGVLAFGTWMTSIYNTQQELARQSAEVSFKLDVLNEQLAETKRAGSDAINEARDCQRRIDRIEATRFTDADAAKALAPLEARIDRLESTRRR